MRHSTIMVLLASALTMSGCVTSEPKTYGVHDRAWQAMSPDERRIAKKEYKLKNREPRNIVIAQNVHYEKKDYLTPHSSYHNEDGKNDEGIHKEKKEDEVAAIRNESANMSASEHNQKIEPYVVDTPNDVLASTETVKQEFPSISSSALYGDISKEDLGRGSELIVFLQNQLGRPPLLGEMQKVIQFNMDVSPRQARRIIDALGLY